MEQIKPVFIVIDGVDGTGKSSQIKLLQDRINQQGRKVELTREPGGTDAGNKIREILLNSNTVLTPDAELLLFCADRAQHQNKIRKLMGEGISIICDRFLSSTYAYQIFGRKLKPDLLEIIVPQTVSIFPDITIILDMDSAIAVKRASARLATADMATDEGRFEAECGEFFTMCAKGFNGMRVKNNSARLS